MAKYIVKGVRFVDMCGNSEEIVLGIVDLQNNKEFIKTKRPSEVGHFYYEENAYHTFIFDKVKELKVEDLTDFRAPNWKTQSNG